MTLEASPLQITAPAHQAVVLSEDDSQDLVQLADLRSHPDVVIIDGSIGLRTELEQLQPALTPAELCAAPRWAWYPWRRTLVAVLGPLPFRRLRLDRNRNKITTVEQDAFRTLRIGIVGLSVGHSIAHTLALEGLCGELRLADNDTIELSNLNRIPASLLDIGVNKAIVVARRIAELDPYLHTDVLTDGLTEDNIDTFLDGLDLVIEECDSLEMKVRIREEARKRGIPVLMETSDRGLFDVERFDVEPDRPLFHGMLGDIEASSLRGLSTHDKAPHVMRILQTAELSDRMAASMVEIDRTVSTWPQLGGDVQLGGATVAAAVRRFGRGERLPSGRIRVDLADALDGLSASTGSVASGPANGPVPVDLTHQAPTTAVDAVVHAIQLAPSGGNSQPWAVEITPAGVDIQLVRSRTSAMDVEFRGSYVGIGAAAFNAQVAAARHSMLASLTEFPLGPDSDVAVSIAFTPGTDPGLADCYDSMVHRITNRNIGRRETLDPELVDRLHAVVHSAGAQLHLVTNPARLAAVADILGESDRIRFLTPVLHRQMMDELKWPAADRAALGIDVATLGMDASDLAKLAVGRRADVMTQLASWGAGAALGDNTRDRITASSAVAVVSVPGGTPSHYLQGGMAVEQLWIQAGRDDLGVQPVSPVFLYARSQADFTGLSAEFSGDLQDLRSRFEQAVGLGPYHVPVLVMRLSRGAPPPTVRSQRLDRTAVLSPFTKSISRRGGSR